MFFAWQAQGFRDVAKHAEGAGVREGATTLAGVVGLKRLRNGAWPVAGAGISSCVKSMFVASDAESVEGLQISCRGSVTVPRPNFFAASAVLLTHPLTNC